MILSRNCLLITISVGDKVDETIVTMLNAETTGITTLISLTKDYQARLEENLAALRRLKEDYPDKVCSAICSIFLKRCV